MRGVLGEEGSGVARDARALPAVAGLCASSGMRGRGDGAPVVRGQRMHEDVGGEGLRAANRTVSCKDAAGGARRESGTRGLRASGRTENGYKLAGGEERRASHPLTRYPPARPTLLSACGVVLPALGLPPLVRRLAAVHSVQRRLGVVVRVQGVEFGLRAVAQRVRRYAPAPCRDPPVYLAD